MKASSWIEQRTRTCPSSPGAAIFSQASSGITVRSVHGQPRGAALALSRLSSFAIASFRCDFLDRTLRRRAHKEQRWGNDDRLGLRCSSPDNRTRMLLLSSPRCARVRRASLLLLAAALLHVTTASLQAAPRCPSHLDCAKEKRHFCKSGSSHCGPCLYPLEENEDGLCVVRKRHHQKAKVYPDLDEEIDFLHSVIQKQQVSEVRPEPKQSDHFASISFQSDIRTTRPHAPETQNVQTSTAAPATGTTVQPTTRVTGGGVRVGPIVTPSTSSEKIIVILISVCVVAGTATLILAAVCAVKLQRDSRLTQKVDYPAFGGATVAPVKANGASFGDQTLAQNAQMFLYQHQKQQMLSMGKQKPEPKAVDTDVTSDEEDVGGDFTVYECPGLAPTGEMEVKNPLFDDSTLPYQGNHH